MRISFIHLATFLALAASSRAEEPISQADARKHVLELGQASEAFVKACRGTFEQVPAPMREMAPALGSLTDLVLEDQVDSERYGATIETIKGILSDAQEPLDALVAGMDEDQVEEGDHSISNVMGHWNNMRYHVQKLDWVGALSQTENSVRVGPISAEEAVSALEALDAFVVGATGLNDLLATQEEEFMYRNLFFTQIGGILKQVPVVHQHLTSVPPWWTPDAYRAVSEILRIHRVTRNQLKDFEGELTEADHRFTRSLQDLILALDPIEGGVRQAEERVQIVYEPPPK